MPPQDLDQVAAPNGDCDPYRAEARRALLDAAWQELQRHEDEHPACWHSTVLKLRELYPDDSSADLAQALSPLMERRLTPTAVRILVHDARVAFARALWRAAWVGCEAASSDEVQSSCKNWGFGRTFPACLGSERRQPSTQREHLSSLNTGHDGPLL